MKNDHLVDLLDAVDSRGKDELEDFLRGILTPAELEQVAKRYQIIKKLRRGETHRRIAEELEVGVATVARGSRELSRGRFGYVK